ncbi:hypothetical protein DFH07DRAFT_770449 [Mycena maculata]|uniref:Uncharacterized protein n=1 Tax=Mycena maculata TaxID=230809 RepID=A0AAD7NKQ4_9AGAR|nr:hypothetical protein DFH07DRAFT_770449 [Mycena maculata]
MSRQEADDGDVASAEDHAEEPRRHGCARVMPCIQGFSSESFPGRRINGGGAAGGSSTSALDYPLLSPCHEGIASRIQRRALQQELGCHVGKVGRGNQETGESRWRCTYGKGCWCSPRLPQQGMRDLPYVSDYRWRWASGGVAMGIIYVLGSSPRARALNNTRAWEINFCTNEPSYQANSAQIGPDEALGALQQWNPLVG